jgi:hypothetical protein
VPGIGIEIETTVTGSVVNTGAGGFANAIFAFPLSGFGQFVFNSVVNVGIDVNAPVLGGVTNAGFITGTNIIAIRSTAAIPGGITNTGYIGADPVDQGFATAIGIAASGPLQGGISNTGIIAGAGFEPIDPLFGAGVAIDLSQVTTPTTITQTAGQILGAINFSGNADRLLISGGGVGGGLNAPAGSGAGVMLTGGVLAFGPNFNGLSASETVQSASNLAFLTQSGGTIVLQVNNSTVAGTFPTISAGNITLTSVAAAGQTVLASIPATSPASIPRRAPPSSVISSTPARSASAPRISRWRSASTWRRPVCSPATSAIPAPFPLRALAPRPAP